MYRDRIITAFDEVIQNSFVSDYKKIKDSMNAINEYLEELTIPYKYSYDEYCVDILTTNKELLNNMSDEDLKTFDTVNYVFVILTEMVYKKQVEYAVAPNISFEISSIVEMLKNNKE